MMVHQCKEELPYLSILHDTSYILPKITLGGIKVKTEPTFHIIGGVKDGKDVNQVLGRLVTYTAW